MQVLDNRMDKMTDHIKELTPTDIAIILLMDNINICKGRRKHLRTFKELTPSMWNFTGRAIIIPFVSELVKQHTNKKEDMCQSQKDVLKLNSSDVLYSAKNKDDKIFEKYKDYYILSAMDKAYNSLPISKKRFSEMSETEFNSWLSSSDFSKTKKRYKLNVPKLEEIIDTTNSSRKTAAFVLPLSLEDNSTITGTSAILKEFETEFQLHSGSQNPEFLPFDTLNKTFDVDTARSRYECMKSQSKHVSNMANFTNSLHSTEKHLDGVLLGDITDFPQGANLTDEDDFEDDFDLERDGEDTTVEATNTMCTLENERRRFRNEDESFWQLYNDFSSRVQIAVASGNEERYLETISSLQTENLHVHRDHLNRSFLHIAIEKGNNQFAKALIFSGFNVNIKEGCGLTPLHLAVLSANYPIVEFLLNRNAKFDGSMFSGIPTPKNVAEKLHLSDVLDLMAGKEADSDEENSLVSAIDRTLRAPQQADELYSENMHSNELVVGRDAAGVVTPVVGDVGTCKTNNATMARSCSFGWAGICVGDMHNKGYLCEACFKEHGKSGLHYIVHDVLKRKKLTSEAFKSRKFQENFLLQIREANRDVCLGYCIAACLQFQESVFFPSNSELARSMKANGNHSYVILSRFKEWLSKGCAEDVAFKHHSNTFCDYGPLMQLYDDCIRHCDGRAREVVYKLLVPVYSQLGFRNYFQETFRHAVNIIAKWPKVTRLILQDNCSVNLTGNQGKGIELDAYVETEVVRPLKTYISGHSTVNMCQRIMGNVDLMKSCRARSLQKSGKL